MTKVQFNIGIIADIEVFDKDISSIKEIGEFLAEDIERIYNNYDDFLEVVFLEVETL